MTIAELFTQLKTSGLEVAYDSFPADNCPDPPFIVFRELSTNNFGADDRVRQKVRRIEIELITIGKDLTAEEAVEACLDEFTYWNITESYSDNEQTWSTFYTIEI